MAEGEVAAGMAQGEQMNGGNLALDSKRMWWNFKITQKHRLLTTEQ